jgi:hypothetical protein
MRHLKPKGTPIKIKNNVYYLKFTLDVIDELQDRTELPMSEIISLTTSKKHREAAIKLIIKYLTRQEIEVKKDELDYYSTMLLNTYIDQLKYKDMPEPERINEPVEYQFIDIEHWFYIGKFVLGLQTDEVWGMTIGQIRTLEHSHSKYSKQFKEDKEVDIMDIG